MQVKYSLAYKIGYFQGLPRQYRVVLMSKYNILESIDIIIKQLKSIKLPNPLLLSDGIDLTFKN